MGGRLDFRHHAKGRVMPPTFGLLPNMAMSAKPIAAPFLRHFTAPCLLFPEKFI
jgi:hypothetical protein